MKLIYIQPSSPEEPYQFISVTLDEGDTLGNFHGPAFFHVPIVEGNTEYDDIVRRGLLIEPPET